MCDKVKYNTRKEANQAINGIHDKLVNSMKKGMTSYFCIECDAWHLTTHGKKSKLATSFKNKSVVINTTNKKKRKRDQTLFISNIASFKIR